MRRLAVIILLLIPSTSLAFCSDEGASVIFVNGILNTVEQAKDSLKNLRTEYVKRTGDKKTIFLNGYNPSHLAGVGDLIQTAIQGFSTSITEYDQNTILLQIHPELTTRKVLLVGHSQGSFYTNNIYSYFLSHGEPRESVGVYNVATPASYVAGGGGYLTSQYDSIIAAYAGYVTKVGGLLPLTPNIAVDGSSVGNGHLFVENYLTFSGDKIVADIQSGLSRLQAKEGTASDGCFDPPVEDLRYKAQQTFFAIADPLATGLKVATINGYSLTLAAVGAVENTFDFIASAFGFGAETTATAPTQSDGFNLAGFALVKAIAGSSIDLDTFDDLASSQGGAVALAVPPTKTQLQTQSQEGHILGEETVAPPEPLIPAPNLQPISSPGYGGGGTAPQADSASVETATNEATSTPTPEPEPLVEPTPTSTVVYEQGEINESVDGFNICGGGGCDNFNGISRNWSWFNRGAYTFDKALIFLYTAGAGTGEILNGRIRLNIYAADTDFQNHHFMQDHIKGNLLYSSDWVDLSNFSTPASACDAYTPEFLYTECEREFVFPTSVVLQQDHAYIFAFEGENVDGTFPPNPTYDNFVQLLTLCSGNAFAADFSELCKLNAKQKMMITFVKIGEGAATPSPLDTPPPPPDFVQPVITITSGPGEGESTASSTTVHFEFDVTDNSGSVASINCSIDSAPQAGCTSPYETNLAPGAHSFTIFAADPEGNTSSLTRSFIVLP